MQEPPSLESRLIQVLAVIALVAVGGVLAILPYRFYERDIRHARVDAHRISSLMHAALSEALLRGQDTSDLINRFQSIADFELRLNRLEEGTLHPAATTGKATSRVSGTDLDYTAPPIRDREGRIWLAEMRFDLSSMKRDSVRIIIDLVLAVLLGSLMFSAGIFFLVRNALLRPLRTVEQRIAKLETGDAKIELPDFHSREMWALANTIERVCSTRIAPGPPGGEPSR